MRGCIASRYVFQSFWQTDNGSSGYADWADMLERSRTAIGAALRDHDTPRILSILFDRLYVLRNQLVHGGSTWNSDVNRAQVREALLQRLAAVRGRLSLCADQAAAEKWWLRSSEEHTSELQSRIRISSAVFCWKNKIYKY